MRVSCLLNRCPLPWNAIQGLGVHFQHSVGQRTGVYRTENYINRHFAQGEEPPGTGGGRVFSFDANFGLLATRWRRWRRCDS